MMLRIISIIFVLSLLFVSCDTTSTYVKKDGDTGTQASSFDAGSIDDDGSQESNVENNKSERADAKTDAVKEKEEDIDLDSDTLAVIGKWLLTKSKYKHIKEYMREKFGQNLNDDQEKEFIEYLVNKKLMAMEARRLGYADKPEVKVKYEWDFDDIISHMYYDDVIERKSKVSTSQARDYYNKNKEDFIEIKAGHILVKNRGLAKSLYSRIIKGEDFEKLAAKYSEDESTKQNGGKLGYFTKGAMVQEFEDAAFALSKNAVSEPVKSIYGYHLIKLYDRRKISFDDSKDRIVKMIKNKKKKEVFKDTIKDLKKRYRVVINEDIIK